MSTPPSNQPQVQDLELRPGPGKKVSWDKVAGADEYEIRVQAGKAGVLTDLPGFPVDWPDTNYNLDTIDSATIPPGTDELILFVYPLDNATKKYLPIKGEGDISSLLLKPTGSATSGRGNPPTGARTPKQTGQPVKKPVALWEKIGVVIVILLAIAGLIALTIPIIKYFSKPGKTNDVAAAEPAKPELKPKSDPKKTDQKAAAATATPQDQKLAAADTGCDGCDETETAIPAGKNVSPRKGTPPKEGAPLVGKKKTEAACPPATTIAPTPTPVKLAWPFQQDPSLQMNILADDCVYDSTVACAEVVAILPPGADYVYRYPIGWTIKVVTTYEKVESAFNMGTRLSPHWVLTKEYTGGSIESLRLHNIDTQSLEVTFKLTRTINPKPTPGK